MIRERILSSVLLPAPFRPMIPTTSPAAMSKVTSRRAQKVSGGRRRGRCASRAAGRRKAPAERLADGPVRDSSAAEAVFLPEVPNPNYGVAHERLSDDIGEGPLHAPEVERARNKHEQGDGRARDEDRPGPSSPSRGAPSGTLRRPRPSD